MPTDALTRRRGRRPAGFCQEQTLVMTEQFSSMKCDGFHIPYLLDKLLEAPFHGQAVKTVAYLTVSTAQLGISKTAIAKLHGGGPAYPLQLHEHPGSQGERLSVYFCTKLVGTLARPKWRWQVN